MPHVTYHIIPCIIIISVNTKVVLGTSKLQKGKSCFLFFFLCFKKNAPQIWGAHKSPGVLNRKQTLFSSSGMKPEPCNSDQLQGYAEPDGLKTTLCVVRVLRTLHMPLIPKLKVSFGIKGIKYSW